LIRILLIIRQKVNCFLIITLKLFKF